MLISSSSVCTHIVVRARLVSTKLRAQSALIYAQLSLLVKLVDSQLQYNHVVRCDKAVRFSLESNKL